MNAMNRRSFLSTTGLGSIALNALLQQDASAAGKAQALAGLPHHTPKAKRVIFLYMSGGPSHLETFDWKPKLAELDGKPMPESFTKGQPIAQLQGQVLKAQGGSHQVQAVRQEWPVDQRFSAVSRQDG